MKTLSNLLERFSRSLGKDVVAKEAVIVCIKELCGFDISPEDISIKDGALRIKASPSKKNEINIHEAQILSGVRERTGQKISKILYS
jgi:hypothetical protein